MEKQSEPLLRIAFFLGMGLLLMLTTRVAGDMGTGERNGMPVSMPPDASGTRIQVPVLNYLGENNVAEAWVEVQNVGVTYTKAVLVLWGESGLCPPQASGPWKVECSGLLRPGTAWYFKGSQIPFWAKSGIVYTLNVEQTGGDIFADAVCEALFETVLGNHDEWRSFDIAFREGSTWSGFDFAAHEGQPVVVTVKRDAPGDVTPGVSVNASYTGISEDMEGLGPPYGYFAPRIMHGYNGLSSIITIQNSGDDCTSIWLYFKEDGNCELMVAQHIEFLAPGEAISIGPITEADVPFRSPEIDAPWLGNVYITANEPLGIIVDQVGNDLLMTYNGEPYFDGAGSLVNYAPLIFREYNGWETNITVQNLTSTSSPTYVTVDFLDDEGNIITTMEDWICRNGSKTFTLPVSNNLPGHDVGAARIESHQMDSQQPQNVVTVVQLIKYSDPAKTQALEALAYNAFSSQMVADVGMIAFPLVAKAMGTYGVISEIAIQNLNSNPGITDLAVLIYDQNGFLGYGSESIEADMVKYINLNTWDAINPGFVGMALISATATTQSGGYALAALAIERQGTALGWDIPGDEVSASPGLPVFDGTAFEEIPEPSPQPPPTPVPPTSGGTRIQVPILNYLGEDDIARTWIEVQNVGHAYAKSVLVVWGESGDCPPQANGPVKVECSGLLKPGTAWHFKDAQIPIGAKSAIVYSLNAGEAGGDIFADAVCEALYENVMGDDDEWRRFDRAFREDLTWFGFDFGLYQSPDLAVTVRRTGPGDDTPGVSVNSSYSGICGEVEGVYDPVFGGYSYYASLVYAGAANGITSWLYIQNSGDECTSVELWFRRRDDCQQATICEIPFLAPGETVGFGAMYCVGPGFVGSTRLRSSQPLGIVVDQIGNDMLMTYTGVPADVPESDFTAGSPVNYAPLIFREDRGWETIITVQNLSSTVSTVIQVDFLEADGSVIVTMDGAICPGGAEDFTLPVIGTLPGQEVGAVRVESQDWNVQSVVSLVKYDGNVMMEAVAYNALPSHWVTDVDVVAFPGLHKDAQGWISGIAIQNLNPSPGITDLAVLIYDQNGFLDSVSESIEANQVKYIDLNTWDVISPGFVGMAVISALSTTQSGGYALATMALERWGTAFGWHIPGDEVSGSPGLPVFDGTAFEEIPEPFPQPPYTPTPLATGGTRIQLPVLGAIGDNDAGVDPWIEVQNVGEVYAKVALVLWGESGPCPPQAVGPLRVACSGMLKPGTAWRFRGSGILGGAISGIVYSLSGGETGEDIFADGVCASLGSDVIGDDDEWRRFDRAFREGSTWSGFDFGLFDDPPLAVTVRRSGPGDVEPGVSVNSSYSGISEEVEGVYDPYVGGYGYFAPLVYADGDNGFTSWLNIQNSGDECTSVEIWFRGQDDCQQATIREVPLLAPGETVLFDARNSVGPSFAGSAWLRASQPLGIVVDHVGNDLLLTYVGLPASASGSEVNYAPLFFREYHGWETTITVQNLSAGIDALVWVDFMDASGNIINTQESWICPEGSKSFVLSATQELPGHHVGAARISSQNWWPACGPSGDVAGIHSVVGLVRYSGSEPREATMYNAFPSLEDTEVGLLALPGLDKGVGEWTSEVAIQNINPNPGYTDFAILVYDESGLLDYVCERLNENQVEYINFDAWGYINEGFEGSAMIAATHTTQDGGFGLAAVEVGRMGTTMGHDLPGDEIGGSQSFTVLNEFEFEILPECTPEPPPSPSPLPAIGTRILAPAVVSEIGWSGWEASIRVQNVGQEGTWVAVIYWGDAGNCPPDHNGPLDTWNKQWLPPNAGWTVLSPDLARSAILLSFQNEPLIQPDETTEPDGQPLTATVKRTAPGDATPGVPVTSSYSGICEGMVGVTDPVSGGYAYYAPLVYADVPQGFNSWLSIQNAGVECASVEIWFREQGDCLRATISEISILAPGETYLYDASDCVGPDFVGSAWLRSSQPLGVVIDHVGEDVLMTHTGVPSDVPDAGFTAGSTINYAPLMFREDQGWETTITVQNLSPVTNAKVKVYFLDDEGDIITTLVDWVCPRGSENFTLPRLNDLSGLNVGAVRVESQASYTPAGPLSAPNISSVVTLFKGSLTQPPYLMEAVTYNALPPHWVSDVGVIAIPGIWKALHTSGITSEIALQNVNPNPGYTDCVLFLFDEAGLAVDSLYWRLKQKQVTYVVFEDLPEVPPDFVGSALISGMRTTQAGGYALAALEVERYRTKLGFDVPGDEGAGSCGFPVSQGVEVAYAMVYVDDDWADEVWGTHLGKGRSGEDILKGWNGFDTIQNGHDAVETGGTVVVYDGLYGGGIVLTKDGLTLEAGSKPIIDGGGGPGITVQANNITIVGFEFTNCSPALLLGPHISGGSISGCAVNQCHFNNNTCRVAVEVVAHDGVVDAENNYWDSCTGPQHDNNPLGQGELILPPSANVDYVPWLYPCAVAWGDTCLQNNLMGTADDFLVGSSPQYADQDSYAVGFYNPLGQARLTSISFQWYDPGSVDLSVHLGPEGPCPVCEPLGRGEGPLGELLGAFDSGGFMGNWDWERVVLGDSVCLQIPAKSCFYVVWTMKAGRDRPRILADAGHVASASWIYNAEQGMWKCFAGYEYMVRACLEYDAGCIELQEQDITWSHPYRGAYPCVCDDYAVQAIFHNTCETSASVFVEFYDAPWGLFTMPPVGAEPYCVSSASVTGDGADTVVCECGYHHFSDEKNWWARNLLISWNRDMNFCFDDPDVRYFSRRCRMTVWPDEPWDHEPVRWNLKPIAIPVWNDTGMPLTVALFLEDVPVGWEVTLSETLLVLQPFGTPSDRDSVYVTVWPDGQEPEDPVIMRVRGFKCDGEWGEVEIEFLPYPERIYVGPDGRRVQPVHARAIRWSPRYPCENVPYDVWARVVNEVSNSAYPKFFLGLARWGFFMPVEALFYPVLWGGIGGSGI
ncbi:MAG: hypothetical protein JSV84_07100, partial [Gemmatimonadota bacterium]